MTLPATALLPPGLSGLHGQDPTAVQIQYPCYANVPTENKWFCTDYLKTYHGELQTATLQHLQITVLALLLGVVIALPLAVLAHRYSFLAGGVQGVSTIIYTIPSLALLPFLVPLFDLTQTTVVIGLALYALTILVRATMEGLRAVPDDVIESARGLGYGAFRMLLRVQLPLAFPVIMAGLRVATVSTVALTTIGSLVGHGGLGNLIGDGVFNGFRAELLAAAVLCVILAVLLDALLVVVQWLLTPWTHRARARRGASAATSAPDGAVAVAS